jgi:hypothetical protein
MPGEQVKVPGQIKREIAVFSATTGRTQGSLLADAWREYRQRHADELTEGLRWAQAVLDNPAESAIAASGMDPKDIDELRDAFGE